MFSRREGSVSDVFGSSHTWGEKKNNTKHKSCCKYDGLKNDINILVYAQNMISYIYSTPGHE